uniref:Uncharacterized protein n=1 Tax=Oryza brachyantha TaxID=4533 RepID=J3LI66_ORYBR
MSGLPRAPRGHLHEYAPGVLVHSPKHGYLSRRSHSLISSRIAQIDRNQLELIRKKNGFCMGGVLFLTSASAVDVGVALVAHGAIAPIPFSVGGVDAHAVVGAAREVCRRVTPGGAAVAAAVPDGPIQHDGHGEVAGPVKISAVAAAGAAATEPLGVRHEHVARLGGAVVLKGDVPRLVLVHVVGVEAGGYRGLAASHAGARRRGNGGRRRRSAQGHAAGHVHLIGVH